MERLTFSTKFGAGLWECPNFSCGEICRKNDCRTCPIQKSFNRLADYEDAEEQGRLIEFPVAIGQHLWFANDYGIIEELTVHELNVSSRGQTMLAYSDSSGNRSYYSLRYIGETIFPTREEAEAKLAELEEQNGQIDKT